MKRSLRLLLVLLLGIADFAPAHACGQRPLADLVRLVAKLRDVPGLQAQVARILADPHVPSDIRDLLSDALATEDLTVVQLTDRLRQALGVRPTTKAKHRLRKTSRVKIVHRPGRPKSLNRQRLEEAAQHGGRDLLPRGHVVLVGDRAPTARDNDLLRLIHELAHVRFRGFLEANVEDLAKRFPPDLIALGADGKYRVDEQLANYLNERYAWEAQWRAARALHGRYFDDWPTTFGDPLSADAPEAAALGAIHDRVVRVYQITDQRLLALRAIPLSDVFRRGIPR